MKTHATISYFLSFTSLAAVLAAHPPESRAEGKPAADAKAATAAQAAAEGYDFVISNGTLTYNGRMAPATLKSVVDSLRMRYLEANIVFEPELSDVMIPDLKLRARSLPEMLEAIRVASGNKFDWLGPGSPAPNVPASAPNLPGGIDPQTGLPLAAPTSNPSTGLFVLREPPWTGQSARVVEAFNVERYINHKIAEAHKGMTWEESRDFGEMTADQLESLIVQTVASFKQIGEGDVRQSLKFQYHAGARLLIVIGLREDMEVARKVVNSLTAEGGNRFSFSEAVQNFDEAFGMTGGGASGGVGAAAQSEPLSVEALPLKFVGLSSAHQAALALVTDPRSKVIDDERAKTLVVVATKPELSAIKKAVEKIDQASKPYVGDNPAKAR